MGMSDTDLQTKLLSWLQEEGYTLELAVADGFARAGFDVSLANFYPDPATKQPRQIDVVARFPHSKGTFIFSLYIECKRSLRNPWILFTSDISEDGYQPFFSHSFMSENTRIAAIGLYEEFLSLPWARYEGIDGVGLVQAFKKGDDIAYKASTSALAATISLLGQLKQLRWDPLAFGVPVVIFDNSLYECCVRQSDKVQITQIDRGRLFLPFPMGDEHGGYIHVVPRATLPEFAAEAWKAAHACSELFSKLAEEKLKSI